MHDKYVITLKAHNQQWFACRNKHGHFVFLRDVLLANTYENYIVASNDIRIMIGMRTVINKRYHAMLLVEPFILYSTQKELFEVAE